MVCFEYYFLKNLVKSILLNLDKDQSKKNEGEKTEGHDNDENMEQKDDQQDQPKFPEDEEKRAHQDEHLEDPEAELEMEDETHGKNEPQVPKHVQPTNQFYCT